MADAGALVVGARRLRKHVAIHLEVVTGEPRVALVGHLGDYRDLAIPVGDDGDSLILVHEGTRGSERLPGPFKSGLYHLAMRHPDVELVPVYLENLYRSMPKGAHIPVPLTCAVRFGPPLLRVPNEDKAAFLERARDAVIALMGDTPK